MQKENLKKLNEELFKAVDDLNFDLVLHALNKGAQVNALDSNGQTALLKALKYENFKIYDLLFLSIRSADEISFFLSQSGASILMLESIAMIAPRNISML